MKTVFEKTLSVLLTVAALTIAGIQVKREFWPATAAVPPERRSYHIEDWRSMLAAANIIGSRSAPVTVAVFTDFQCPFCKRFDSALAVAQNKFPNQVAAAIIHMPLRGHEAAPDAAKASECASEQGRFQEAIRALYRKQDSLGKIPWIRFAVEAGVTDTIRFAGCMRDSTAGRRIALGQSEASRRGFNTTPTVVLNGWRYGAPPSDSELVRAIGQLLDGKRPYPGFNKADVVRTARLIGLR
jgi:hypothetical protein